MSSGQIDAPQPTLLILYCYIFCGIVENEVVRHSLQTSLHVLIKGFSQCGTVGPGGHGVCTEF